MTALEKLAQDDAATVLTSCFNRQREAYLSDPIPSIAQRKDDLNRLKAILNENRDAIVEAISRDYGNRSRHESLFAEIISVTDAINDSIKNLKKWARPQKRHVDMVSYPGGKNQVIPQPLPWA